MELYTGVREIQVRPDIINQLYQDKFLDLDAEDRILDRRLSFKNQNEYILLQSLHSNQSAIGRVKGNRIILVNGKDITINNVTPRNVRQRMVMDALLDDNIQVVVLFGKAGTGKTLCTLATGLHKIETAKYRRFILSRPMSQLGKRQLGILPGEVNEKFGPYLDNYIDNIEHLLSGRYKNTNDLISQYRMDFKPLQLIQGANWADAFIIIDNRKSTR